MPLYLINDFVITLFIQKYRFITMFTEAMEISLIVVQHVLVSTELIKATLQTSCMICQSVHSNVKKWAYDNCKTRVGRLGLAFRVGLLRTVLGLVYFCPTVPSHRWFRTNPKVSMLACHDA